MSENERVIKWLLSENTGLSSKFMLRVHLGEKVSSYVDYPHDRYDFLRCVNLVDCVPEVRNSFQKISDTAPQWKAIIEKWDRLVTAAKSDDSDFHVILCAVVSHARMWTKEDMEKVNEFYREEEIGQ